MSKNTHDSDVGFIKALAELLRENDLTEVEVLREYGEDDTLNVRVARQIHAAPVAAPPSVAVTAQPLPLPKRPHPPPRPPPRQRPCPQRKDTLTPRAHGQHPYLAPEPGAAAFVCWQLAAEEVSLCC